MQKRRWLPRLSLRIRTKLILAFVASLVISIGFLAAMIFFFVRFFFYSAGPEHTALIQEMERSQERSAIIADSLAAGQSRAALRQAAIPPDLSPALRIRLVQTDGTVSVDSAGLQEGELIPAADILRWLELSNGEVRVSVVMPQRIYVADELWGYYTVEPLDPTLLPTLKDVQPISERGTIYFVGGLVVIAVLNILLHLFVGQHLVKPTRILSDVVGRIAKGDFNARSGLTKRGDELGQLARDIDTMALGLHEAQEQTKASEEARRYLVMAVSHDLRTPLTAMLANIEAIQTGVTDQPERSLQVARDKGLQLKQLIDDLFELTALEAGRQEWQTVRTDVGELVRQEVIAVLPDLEARGIELEIAIPEAPCWANVAPGKVERVVANLIANAIKYGLSGGWLGVSVTAETDWVEIAVADSGPGIGPGDQQRIFERFYRPDSARQNTAGSGLGLAIAREIVARHGGEIGVDARPEGGARFWVRLPV